MRATWDIERRIHVDVPVRADGTTHVVVVADTHSAPHPSALELVRAAAPDVILHAGDIGDYAVLDDFSRVTPQLVAVRGNIDGRTMDLPDAVTLHFRRGAREVTRWLLIHIGVQGARLRAPVRALAAREQCDLVICGHSHLPLIARDGALAIFNPGSIGPRRFQLPIVYGTIAIGPAGIEFGHVNCETGAAWVPLFTAI